MVEGGIDGGCRDGAPEAVDGKGSVGNGLRARQGGRTGGASCVEVALAAEQFDEVVGGAVGEGRVDDRKV